MQIFYNVKKTWLIQVLSIRYPFMFIVNRPHAIEVTERGVHMPESQVRTEILSRLRNVRGHIAGIERMVDEQQDCSNILVQISAVRSSVEKIGITLLENNAMECVLNNKHSTPEDQKNLEQVVKQMLTFLKR